MDNWKENIEVFFLSPMEAAYNIKVKIAKDNTWEFTPFESGWYWWSCSPGCLPDSEPVGPFDSESEALRDAVEVD